MKVAVEPGKYVVAVSGGVDSMVLLDLLRQIDDVELIVTHFDHGIRPDSAADRRLVEDQAKKFDLVFVSETGKLGPKASEAVARQARYDFLRKVKAQHGARTVITAHHQDDVLETAIINLLRGTNRRGLSSLQSTEEILRPLLNYEKAEIIRYANQHALRWREDTTNQDDAYLRNHIRHNILPRFSLADKAKLLQLIGGTTQLNHELDERLADLMATQKGSLDRQWFVALDHRLAREVMAAWLRRNHIREFDRKTLERLVVVAKTGAYGTKTDVINRWSMTVSHNLLALERPER